MAVAIGQHHGFKPFSRSQGCSLQSFTHLDKILELRPTDLVQSLKQTFEVANIHRSISTPCLSRATETIPKIEIVGGHQALGIRSLVLKAATALSCGSEPIPVTSGLGGVYFLPGRNDNVIAVAKPVDEEPLAFNNPKGFGGLMPGQPGLKQSIRIGETGIRELAAYLLDHDGFAGVPPTALVKISNVAFNVNDVKTVLAAPIKIASLQHYVDHDFDAGELGSSGFSVASVHRIGILDIRLLNLDRHAGNILVKKHCQHENYAVGPAELVPIDHGLCLPEWLDDPYFEWLYWPQASVPFSQPEIEYISNLDPFKDAELLRTELPALRESSIRVYVLCSIFLKRAADAGLRLADIGAMMSREFGVGEENLSVLETLCAKAKANVLVSNNNDHEKNNEWSAEETEGDFDQMFQLDTEIGENSSEVFDLPKLLQSKVTGFSSARSMPRSSNALETDHENYPNKIFKDECSDGDNDNVIADDGKLGGLMKSLSFSVQKHSYETEGITFEDMNEREWSSFLENFEKLLPEIFEGTMCISSKQRLGTSCNF